MSTYLRRRAIEKILNNHSPLRLSQILSYLSDRADDSLNITERNVRNDLKELANDNIVYQVAHGHDGKALGEGEDEDDSTKVAYHLWYYIEADQDSVSGERVLNDNNGRLFFDREILRGKLGIYRGPVRHIKPGVFIILFELSDTLYHLSIDTQNTYEPFHLIVSRAHHNNFGSINNKFYMENSKNSAVLQFNKPALSSIEFDKAQFCISFYPNHHEQVIITDMNSTNGTNASSISLNESKTIMSNFYTQTKTSYIGNISTPNFIKLGRESKTVEMSSQFALPAIIDINGQNQFIILGATRF